MQEDVIDRRNYCNQCEAVIECIHKKFFRGRYESQFQEGTESGYAPWGTATIVEIVSNYPVQPDMCTEHYIPYVHEGKVRWDIDLSDANLVNIKEQLQIGHNHRFSVRTIDDLVRWIDSDHRNNGYCSCNHVEWTAATEIPGLLFSYRILFTGEFDNFHQINTLTMNRTFSRERCIISAFIARYVCISLGVRCISRTQENAVEANLHMCMQHLKPDVLQNMLDQLHQGSSVTDLAQTLYMMIGVGSLLKLTHSVKVGFKPEFVLDVEKYEMIMWHSGEYVAISHSWGAKRYPFTNVGRPVGVTWDIPQPGFDTRAALNEIAKALECKYIWLDWFCVPQVRGSNTQLREISAQGDIFSSATQVVMWLVDSEKNAEVLCNVQLSTMSEEDVDAILDAAQDMLWFSSLWTLQEAFLRPDMYIFHKKQLTDFTLLELLVSMREIIEANSSVSWIKQAATRFQQLGMLSILAKERGELSAAIPYRRASNPESEFNAVRSLFGLSYVLEPCVEEHRDMVKRLLFVEAIAAGDVNMVCHAYGVITPGNCMLPGKGSIIYGDVYSTDPVDRPNITVCQEGITFIRPKFIANVSENIAPYTIMDDISHHEDRVHMLVINRVWVSMGAAFNKNGPGTLAWLCVHVIKTTYSNTWHRIGYSLLPCRSVGPLIVYDGSIIVSGLF